MSLMIIGFVVIAISAIMAWTTATCLKNVDLKPKAKTVFSAIYFATTIALTIGFLLVASIVLK